jgi:hypothetical protein
MVDEANFRRKVPNYIAYRQTFAVFFQKIIGFEELSTA